MQGGFGVDGGGAFDALVQWSPFGLDVLVRGVGAGLQPGGDAVRRARVTVEVTGPQPWHVTGVAEVTFLGLSARVPVDLTIGGRAEPPALEAVDVAQALWDEAAQQSAWDSRPCRPT